MATLLAHDPAHLKRTWDSLKAVMVPGALDPLTKALMYVAVSVTNGCAYCIASHTAAQQAGMSAAMFAELMAVVGMANETNRLANGYQVAIDDRFRTPSPVEGSHGASPVAAGASGARRHQRQPHPRWQDHPRADGAPGMCARPHGCVHPTLESRGQARLPGHRPACTHTVRCPFRCTKEAFRRVFCARLGTNRRGKGGGAWPKTLHERMRGRWCRGARGDRMASDGGWSSICSMR